MQPVLTIRMIQQILSVSVHGGWREDIVKVSSVLENLRVFSVAKSQELILICYLQMSYVLSVPRRRLIELLSETTVDKRYWIMGGDLSMLLDQVFVIKNCYLRYFTVKKTKCDEEPCKDRGYCLSDKRDPSWYKCYCHDWFKGTDCESKFNKSLPRWKSHAIGR